jgi:hypothetical protein
MKSDKKIWILGLAIYVLVFLSTSYCVLAEKEYHLIRTIESPRPEEHGWFGSPMDVEGDLILIASWHADVEGVSKVGNAYLYNVDGDLIASYQSPKPNMLDTFSKSIDILDDRVLIGDLSDQGDWNSVGKAYLFDTHGNHLHTFEAPEPSRGALFGDSVCFTSNLILISEPKGEGTEPQLAGMVHMYDDERTYLKTIYSPSPKSTAYFGQDIENGDGLFLVNEIGSGEVIFPGTVYGFDYDGNHIITIQAPEPEDRACFGNSMDIDGDKIIIGEYYATVGDLYRAGRAYLYNTNGELLQTFESPSPQFGAKFGFSVSVDGDKVVIGEPDADVSPDMKEGKAHVFDINGTLLQSLVAPSPGPIALYGYSVNVEGDTIVIGEPWDEVDGELRAGVVHIYSNDPIKISQVTTEEEVTETTSETITQTGETQKEDTGIPGFPLISLIGGYLLITLLQLVHQKSKIQKT